MLISGQWAIDVNIVNVIGSDNIWMTFHTKCWHVTFIKKF